jgi:DNA polymerase
MADGAWVGDPEMKVQDGWEPNTALGYSAADAERDRAMLIHKAIERDILELVGDAKSEALRELDRQIETFIKKAGEFYRLHHDFETYCDLSVVDVGQDVYSRHPSCEVLMCAYAPNDDKVEQWVPAEGQPMPADLAEYIADPYAIKFAWNKPFEYAIWKNVLGIEIPHNLWRDPMVIALTCSFPGGLGRVGRILGMPEDLQKDKDGKTLIRIFSLPNKPTKKRPQPRVLWHHERELWQRYKEYNISDVYSERAIYKRLRPYNLPKEEWDLWFIDQEINEAGIPINMAMVDNAQAIYEWVLEDRMREMREITGLENPNSTQQILGWLQARGYPFDDMKKGHVARAYDRTTELLDSGEIDDDPDRHEQVEMHRVLELRMEAARSAPKKYEALRRAADRDAGVIRNCFQFSGAQRTWRWAGRVYQPQNLAKPPKYLEKVVERVAQDLEVLDPWSFNQVYTVDRHKSPTGRVVYSSPMDALATGVRPVAQAPEGYEFIDCDLNAIENRVLGWIANCPKILRVFELGRDPYVDFATYLFGGEYDALWAEYKGGDSFKRTISKPGVLGCGYQLGAGHIITNHQTGEQEATGLLGYAWNMGVKEFTPEQSKLSVDVFRSTFEEVPDFWYGIEQAAKKCVRTGQPVQFRMYTFDRKGPFLRMRLPSGHFLHYFKPRLEEMETPWGAMRLTLTYEGLNDKDQWTRLTTHGGKLTENADQATARDLLANGMRIARRRHKIDLRLHVHDQLVGLAPIGRAEEALEYLKSAMEELPAWGRRGPEWVDLPLGSNGFTSKYFMKD